MTNELATARCQTRVYAGTFHGHQCHRKPIVTRDGKAYCKIHDPEYIKAKRATREAKWDEGWANRQARYAIEDARHIATQGLTLEELKQVTPALIRKRILREEK